MNEQCEQCAVAPTGEAGHASLDYYVGGPFPGHHIFKCRECGERWIRHHGETDRFAWTRYAERYPDSLRKPSSAVKGGIPLGR
jgi:hypothetical protein